MRWLEMMLGIYESESINRISSLVQMCSAKLHLRNMKRQEVAPSVGYDACHPLLLFLKVNSTHNPKWRHGNSHGRSSSLSRGT